MDILQALLPAALLAAAAVGLPQLKNLLYRIAAK